MSNIISFVDNILISYCYRKSKDNILQNIDNAVHGKNLIVKGYVILNIRYYRDWILTIRLLIYFLWNFISKDIT